MILFIMNNKYVIYMHKSKKDGKMYIGQTCQVPKYRWGENGKGYQECPDFWDAIQEEGWDNFEHFILKEHLSLEEANYWERYYIAEYHTWIDDPICWGYNMQKGGNNREPSEATKQKASQHAIKLWQSEEHREKISQIMKEKWQNPEMRQKFLDGAEKARQKKKENGESLISEEGKEKISEARKQYIAKYGTPTQGKPRSEETKRKMSQTRKEKKCPTPDRSVPVQCIETGEIFHSRAEAARWAGIKTAGNISLCTQGVRNTAGKHPETNEPLHWKNVDIKIKGEIDNGS